ncbi:MAG: PKD domain-containing protein, partial [Ignavibacteriaceae bacterium]|nr:PKD domain-containing protein [Ignavibacteriaceae bacterium]
MSKWVFVDEMIYPEATLSFAPKVICPGEYVYFFDDQADYDKNNLTYYVDFGDGTNSGPITQPVDELTKSLAVHSYATEGVYHFTMTATNKCGNENTYEHSIIVNNDPTRIPFYYTHNTSTDDDLEGEFEDWSVIPNRQYTTFSVEVNLQSWDNVCGEMDSLVNIFFWYGEVYDINDPNLGPPNGYVQIKAPGTAIAYVPFNVVKPSVGIVAAWYCNKDYYDEWPKVYAQPLDSNFYPIPSFPTIPGQPFELVQPITLDAMQWSDCICAPPTDKIRGTWNYITENGCYHILDIQEDEGYIPPKGGSGILTYRMIAGPDKWPWYESLEYAKGTINMINDTIISFENDTLCSLMPGEYSFKIIDNELTFTPMTTDNCIERYNFLIPHTFIRNESDYQYEDNDRSGCPGDTIGFGIVGGLSYEWHIQGTITEGPEAFYVYDTVGIYEEFVVALNACGRKDTIYTKVNIGNTNLPFADFSMDKWNAKRFEPIQFYTNIWSDFDNYAILWDFGDGNYSTEKNPTHFYNAEGDYTITLRIENGCGFDVQQKYIWIQKETTVCEAKFIYTSVSGTTVNFEDKSLGSITSYFWEFGDGKVSTTKNPVNTYPTEGVYLVTLTVYDSLSNCSNQIKKQIIIGEFTCMANFDFTVNNVTKTVVFRNLSDESASYFYWKFGDNTFTSEKNPTHTYSREATYKVCLVAKDTNSNCMSEICRNVTIGSPQLTADFNYYINPINGSVSFADISAGTPTNWYWDFGDGYWDTIPQIQHTFSQSGEYNVCLSVFNFNTGAFSDICKTIVVITDTTLVSIKADFTYMVDSANDVSFVDKSSGEITNWYWTFGDGTFMSGKDVTHSYSVPGLYNVCLTVYSSASGERSEYCQTIQVGAITCNLNAEFGYFINPTTKQVTFSDKTMGTAHKWFWDFGNGKTSTQRNPVHTFENSGFYLVSLAVRDTNNGCTDYYADFLQIGTADCKADFNYTITNISTNEVKFTNKSIGNIGTYFWYFNDGNFSTLKDPVNIYSSGGLYSVSLTVTDNSGLCMDYITKDVQIGTVNCNADFTFYIDSTTNEVYFSNQTVGTETSFYWLFGDGSYWIGANPHHAYTAPGYYTVSLNTFNATNGCMDYEEKILLIGSPGNDVNADFIYSANLTTRKVNFSNKSNGQNLTYVWNLGDGITSTVQNPEYTY